MLSGCTAFILAGGKSSRMGTDKALLNYRGECLIRYPIRLFQQLSPDVRIIGDPSRYARFGLPVIADCVPSHGPLSGIYTGLKSSSTQYNLFLACDMPLMRPEFFELLFSNSANGDAVVMRFEDGSSSPSALSIRWRVCQQSKPTLPPGCSRSPTFSAALPFPMLAKGNSSNRAFPGKFSPMSTPPKKFASSAASDFSRSRRRQRVPGSVMA